ncbi:MAG: hypothetical protein VB049_00775 [Candidatus Pelethousia sp.]|nr:hypothetical protein [Candidatus Pelethousia sp.]
MNELEENGYIVPPLLYPSATISSNSSWGRSVVVEASCIVSAGAAIGRGALLSGASVIETKDKTGRFVHSGSSATVTKDAAVADYTRVPSGRSSERNKHRTERKKAAGLNSKLFEHNAEALEAAASMLAETGA